ncbi:MAG: Hsp33 family molecular chaperone HslO [Spirochaetales bacterium]|nr:Hsp33 family molecular chaperone HslO [Spirochaetales bacterium]
MITLPLDNPGIESHLASLPHDCRMTFVCGDNELRGMVLAGTAMINHMRRNHGLGILETLVLGQAYTAAGLMTMSMKNADRLTLEIGCNGPIGGLSVEANASGQIRGYLKNVPIPIDTPPESLNLSPYFGAGLLTVNRHIEGAVRPFSGTVHLAYGTIAKDIAYYYLHSEQTKTAVEVSVQFDKNGEVAGSGGLFLQVMPGCSETLITETENLLSTIGSIGKDFASGIPPEEWISRRLSTLSPLVLEEKPLSFSCPCSKDRFARFITNLQTGEAQDIREHGPFPLITTCHNCGSHYSFTKEEIEGLIPPA